MKVEFFFNLSIFIPVFIYALIPTSLGGTLQSAQILFRHGDRYPELNTTSNQLGTLTQLGKRQMYELGRFLRNKYAGILSEEFDPAEVNLVSSDKDRAITSAQLVAYGLFEDFNSVSSWKNNLSKIAFEPIPVRRISREYDRYIQLTESCPKHLEMFKRDILPQFASKFYEENDEFIQAFVRETGIYDPLNITLEDIDRLDPIIMFDEQVVYNATHNLAVQHWAQEYLTNDNLVSLRTDYINLRIATKPMQRLYTGPFLDLLLQNFGSQIMSKRLTLFSGHDRILTVIMSTLGIWDDYQKRVPPNGAALFFELFSENEMSYLQISYKNSSAEPIKLAIPDCGDPCYLLDFQKIFNDIIPTDYEAECRLSDE